jgi:heme a synthase
MSTIAMSAQQPRSQPRAIANWLFAVAALVFAMVVVGGITRLTESGLSITEWKPVSGAIPPLSDAAWQTAFDAYKQVPQYQAIHASMTLGQFKFIFFWEWVHRLLGRVIGLAFALPLLWFALRRAIPARYGWRLTALLALGGLQGAIGWWMVKSGLWQGVAVSHYRLSVHLLLALTILGGLVWTALDLRAGRTSRIKPLAVGVIAVLFVQLLFGAWVAGMDAGKVSQNWPMMGTGILPSGVDWSLAAVTSDPYIVHFIHRWWAWAAVAALVLLARAVRRAGDRRASLAIHTAFGLQVLLGIATVMSGVNIVLAVLHQAVGALLVASTVWGAHAIGRTPAAGNAETN